MVRIVRAIVVAGLVLSLSACATRIAGLTAVSTQAVNINGIDLNDVPTKHHVTGTSERFIFLFIPFGIPRVGEAVDDALTKGGGDLMTNVSVYRTGWWFLVGEAGYKVTGDVLKTAGAGNGEAEGGQ